jgi:hypothetical protein
LISDYQHQESAEGSNVKSHGKSPPDGTCPARLKKTIGTYIYITIVILTPV